MVNDFLILKHKNIDVAVFSMNDRYSIEKIEILDTTFSPVENYIDNTDKTRKFNEWFNNRCIPDSRDGIENLRLAYKISDIRELLLSGYGLSLSDHYWICKKNQNLLWEDINYFNNRYSENMGKQSFLPQEEIIENNNHSPEPATNGSLRKMWVYDPKRNLSYLLKGWLGVKYKQEPFNEVFISMLLDELQIDHVCYELKCIEGGWASQCPNIVSTDTEMVSALDVARKYNIPRKYKDYVAICKQNGLINIEEDLGRMIAVDYLIRNTDRHWNNFGILRNSNTGVWLKAIPLFDNGSSLWSNEIMDLNEPSHSSSFSETNEENIKNINIDNFIDKDKIKNTEDIFEIAFSAFEDKERKIELKKALNAWLKKLYK